MTNEDKKYDELIGTLKNLQKVKAHPGFEADLKRRLNQEKYETSEDQSKKRFWVPSRLVPAFGLAVAAMVVFLLIDLNSVESNDPFLIEPRVRKDVISVSTRDLNEVPTTQVPENNEKSKPEERILPDKKDQEQRLEKKSGGDNGRNLITESEVTPPESTLSNEEETSDEDDLSTELAAGLAIRKSGLNFRQIKQTKQEKEEILELKKKVQIKGKIKTEK